ncbi:acyl-CoA thioesterase [Bacillus sp. 2205SS5-2]|uniref:acyl-CoA thioesterase n=1 Tax=Bacillus sp. 2205SS5-2 TaxID=3109031 RepID=UPI003005A2FD
MLIAKNTIDVRYAETDQMGVVYHANYLVWMELGRTKLSEESGYRYAEMEAAGVFCPVVDLRISYKKPLRYGEQAIVKTWIEAYNGIRLTYGYEIYTSKDELAIVAFSEHICVLKDNFRPVSIKKKFPEWHAVYEQIKK